MSISLTTSAADRVRSHLARRGHGLGLRLSIKATGCSGYSYVIDFADTARPDDLVFEDQGVKVYVDPREFSGAGRHDGRFRASGAERVVSVPEPQRQGRVRLRRKLHGLKNL